MKHVLALSLFLIPVVVFAADNELSEQEKKDGWILLFDGKTVNGWMCGQKPMDNKQVEEGALNAKNQGVYVAHFNQKFSDFIFAADFKLDKGVNSGLFFRIAKPGAGDINRGFEIQIKDDHGKPPSRHECGSLYEFKAPTKQTVKPTGEWNHIEVTCKGPIVKVNLNGEDILEANFDDWPTPGVNPDGSKNKFKWALKDMPREGHIGISDHDKKNAWYKNIKVKPLKQE